jgi:hypothetical protein
MVKKFLFLLSGIIITIATYGFMQCKHSPEQPVKAQLGVDWTPGRNMAVIPHYSEGTIAELTWHTLQDVTFSKKYVQELDVYFWQPKFGPTVKAMEGKDVYITGYVIPVDYDENFYVISRWPYANCYFCGGGGPESVCDLRFNTKTRAYQTDERLTFKGKLKLNANDVYQMNYILEGAAEYTP